MKLEKKSPVNITSAAKWCNKDKEGKRQGKVTHLDKLHCIGENQIDISILQQESSKFYWATRQKIISLVQIEVQKAINKEEVDLDLLKKLKIMSDIIR